MTIFDDPCAGLPAPSDFEFQDAIDSRQNRRIMLLEHHVERLEIALTATIRAIAFIPAMEIAGFDETAKHLAHAAQVLGLDLADLGLKYTTPANDPP